MLSNLENITLKPEYMCPEWIQKQKQKQKFKKINLKIVNEDETKEKNYKYSHILQIVTDEIDFLYFLASILNKNKMTTKDILQELRENMNYIFKTIFRRSYFSGNSATFLFKEFMEKIPGVSFDNDKYLFCPSNKESFTDEESEEENNSDGEYIKIEGVWSIDDIDVFRQYIKNIHQQNIEEYGLNYDNYIFDE